MMTKLGRRFLRGMHEWMGYHVRSVNKWEGGVVCFLRMEKHCAFLAKCC